MADVERRQEPETAGASAGHRDGTPPAEPSTRTAEFEERQVGDLRIRIDRTLCVGFADCVKAAPDGFVVAEDGITVFVNPERVDRATLVEACDVCPVDAITVWDHAGNQIVP
ncbi:MAG: ferredoxin [Gemmatimonadetes bacterium]|nr:ferredoxin [Gemmatimonadota bacterium]